MLFACMLLILSSFRLFSASILRCFMRLSGTSNDWRIWKFFRRERSMGRTVLHSFLGLISAFLSSEWRSRQFSMSIARFLLLSCSHLSRVNWSVTFHQTALFQITRRLQSRAEHISVAVNGSRSYELRMMSWNLVGCHPTKFILTLILEQSSQR